LPRPVAANSTAITPGVTSFQPKASISANAAARVSASRPQRNEEWRRRCSSLCTSERISSSEPVPCWISLLRKRASTTNLIA
jgi:hypothetical protein